MEPGKAEAEAALVEFSNSLSQLETTIQPVLEALDDLRSSGNEDDLDAMTRARLHISLCYSVNSLFCMYLRTQGIDPETHSVVDEITRVQEAFMRMRKVEAGQSADFQPPPNRDRRKHIVKVKASEGKLSALMFPEEGELLRALMNKRKVEKKDDGEHGGPGDEDEEDEPAPDDSGLSHLRSTDQELTEFEELVRKKQRKAAKNEERAKHKELKTQMKALHKKKRKRRKSSKSGKSE